MRASFLLLALVFIAALWALPRQLCDGAASSYWRGEPSQQLALARQVARRVNEHAGGTFYETGNLRFDGQSAIAIYQMTLLGLGQLVLEHPEARDELLPTMRLAAARLVAPATLRYAEQVYGRHGAVHMAPGAGHAYLGYINLGLGMLRLVEPDTELAPLHDRISQQLATRLFRSKSGLIETYPGELWPPDVAAVAGSIGLHARATGVDRSQELALWARRFRGCAVHESGFLIQRMARGSCRAADGPRGSGTAVAAYFIGFAHEELARSLYRSVSASRRSWLGFGAFREYAPGFEGAGDVNSGPVLFGVSVGATGFGIGAARMHKDRATFVELARTAVLFGVHGSSRGEVGFAVGGALGNALLLAMLTARAP